MPQYEYRVIPAPTKGKKAKGIRGPEARFAHALEETLNQLAAEGWNYLRAETLPSEERHGLTSVSTTFRNVLVFRRALRDELADFAPRSPETTPADVSPDQPAAPRPDSDIGADD
ncbi:DUF4177 domain-containing protein [Thalassovita sp.]|uniref:DUF4177 domain-containing protein n=1 Tax=Thalassovita sp. TaxID=1979401 RepID=UPI0029DE8F37|nr:DUF4177 domain-containing protein [Thalassovita sp.]